MCSTGQRCRVAGFCACPNPWKWCPGVALGGFRAGFHGAPFVRPLGALDSETWALGFIEGRGHRGEPSPPRVPVDLLAATKEVRLRVERVLANLEPITQQRDPVLADPRAVWLDITLSIVELESVTILMKRAWWP